MLHKITFILLVVGGLNWLLEVFGWGIGAFLPSGVAQIVYILVGLSAVYTIFTHKNDCKNCEAKGSASMGSSQMSGQQMGGM